eukprot:7385492-Pyramimonas_sp.AAC.1
MTTYYNGASVVAATIELLLWVALWLVTTVDWAIHRPTKPSCWHQLHRMVVAVITCFAVASAVHLAVSGENR